MAYDEAAEEGEARLFRLDAKAEEDRERRRRWFVERFLDSLTPEDAERELFTNTERRFWGLRRHRKYPA